jgi:ABC-2 type transport system permease protein
VKGVSDMRNVWIIAGREFRQRGLSRGFILYTVGFPLFFLFLWAILGFFSPSEPPEAPPVTEEPVLPEVEETLTGIVDQGGIISPTQAAELNFSIYPDSAAANQALQTEEIEAYYLIPPDYIQTGEIHYVRLQHPTEPVTTGVISMLVTQGIIEQSGVQEPEQFQSPFGPMGLQFISVEDGEPATPGFGFEINFAPFIVILFIVLPLFTSGDYLVRSLTQEKSNRVMEILLLSLQPRQLLTGKLLGYGALTFVQYTVWATITVVTLTLMGENIGLLLAELNLSGGEVVYIVLYALGGYTLYSSIMAGLGALAPNMRSANSLTFILMLPIIFPFFFWTAIVSAPHSPLVVGISLFPFSAPLAMLLRMTVTSVPAWEIAVSLALLALTSVGIVLLMARLFRVQSLLSGEAVSLGRVWRVLTTG